MQNVNINQEVENAMMAPPQQPRGIVDLLASELKARDAKARNQLNTMMAPAPDPNTIISQNEKETENNVRQEIMQKMQSMAVKENQNKARMNQALAGIAGQRANNMTRMANGGIVGYAGPDGSQVQGKPTPTLGAVPPSAVGDEQIKQFAEQYTALQAGLAAATTPQDKARSQQLMQDLIRAMGNEHAKVMQYIDSTKGFVAPRSGGMAMGGIVGFQDGGRIKRFQGLEGSEVKRSGGLHPFSLVNWALGKGIDLTVLSAQEIAELASEFSNTEVGQNQRNVLGEVASGAAKKIVDALPIPKADPNASKFPEMDANIQRGRDERQRKAESGGIMNTLKGIFNSDEAAAARQELQQVMQGNNSAPAATTNQGIASLAPPKTGVMGALRSTFSMPSEEEIAYRERANQSINEGEFTNEFAESDKFGAGLVRRIKENPGTAISTLAMAIPVGGWAAGLGVKALTKIVPYVVKHPMLASFLAGSTAKLPMPDVEKALSELGLGEDYEEVKDTLLTGLVGPDPLSGLESDEKTTATDVITSTPAVPAEPAYDPMKGVEAVADPNLRRAIEGAQTAPATGIAAPAAEQDGEVAATQLASTVASNPTPQNMSRFESEISRLMERRESPIRALSNFLKSFSQARGGSMGQNLAIATTAMNAADDAMDKQIIALEQLRRADQISERDFELKKQQVNTERSYREAMGAYYKNIPVVQKEIEQLRQAGRDEEAAARLREQAVTFALPRMAMNSNEARNELGRGATAEQIRDRANELFEKQVEAFIKAVEGPQNSGGSSPSGAIQEGATATNAQGDKVVFTNGTWTPM